MFYPAVRDFPVCLVKEPFDCAQGVPQLVRLNEPKFFWSASLEQVPTKVGTSRTDYLQKRIPVASLATLPCCEKDIPGLISRDK